jgi:hypothetical protein
VNTDDWFEDPPRGDHSLGLDQASAWLQGPEGRVFLTFVTFNCCDRGALQLATEQWIVDHPNWATFGSAGEARAKLRSMITEIHAESCPSASNIPER